MPPVPKKADWPNDEEPVKPNRMSKPSRTAPHQDAVDGGRREAKMRQDERRGDQRDGGEDSRPEGTFSQHQAASFAAGRAEHP
jgi:hypothetical protein